MQPAPAPFTRDVLADWAGSEALGAGEQLVAWLNVSRLSITSTAADQVRLSGLVKGHDRLMRSAVLAWDGAGFTAICPCGAAGPCAHVAALGVAYLAQPSAGHMPALVAREAPRAREDWRTAIALWRPTDAAGATQTLHVTRHADGGYTLATRRLDAPDTEPAEPRQISVPAADAREFEGVHLPNLAAATSLCGPAAPATASPLLGTPAPRVALSELHGQLTVRLGFAYGEVVVAPNESGRWAGPGGGPWLTRDLAAEQAWLKRVESCGGRRLTLGPLTLSGDAALDFLALTVPGLQALGVAVLGQDALPGYRLAAAAPETRVKVSSGVDWLEVSAHVMVDEERVAWDALATAIAQHRRHVTLPSGRQARLPEAWLAAQRPLIGWIADGVLPLDAAGEGRLQRPFAPLVAALSASADHVEADAAWTTFAERLRSFSGIERAWPGPGFVGALRPYQQDGLDFLAFLRDYGLHGVLADDMGLGKTVQAAALLARRHPGADTPSLVVAPAAVLANWRAELARFAPGLRVLVLHGAKRDTGAIDAHDVVITSYATARRDLAAHQLRRYDTVILDEAQAIKNPQAQTTKAMRALSSHLRLCLTGTPIENHLIELWSLFEFLLPGLLGSEKTFKLRYVTPIAAGDADRAAELKLRVAPFMLRRLKQDVAKDLPPRTDVLIHCELAPPQRKLYEAVLAKSRAIVGKGGPEAQAELLTALLRLRQVCCHPALLGVPEAAGLPSAKLEVCLELIETLREGGHRALIFSQFTSLLALLRTELEAQKVPYYYLDGATRDRQGLVDAFNRDDTPLFLISLKAGGTGLNLTGADYVIHFDPWWNPAVEDQATDRAHRIGQTRPVFSYKLIAEDTVEEKLVALQAQKRDLADSLLTAEAGAKSLTRDDWIFLLGAE